MLTPPTYSDDGELILSTDPHPNYLPTLIHLLDSFPYSHTPDFHAQFVSSSMYQDFDGDPLRSLVQYIWRNPFLTLFMTRSNLEIIGILRRIISHLVIAIDQVYNTYMSNTGLQNLDWSGKDRNGLYSPQWYS